MVTEHAPVLNQGKQLYREKGCIGCHRFQGFDNQDEQLVSARQRIMAIWKTRSRTTSWKSRASRNWATLLRTTPPPNSFTRKPQT